MSQQKLKQINISVDKELKDRMKRIAYAEERTISQFIRLAIKKRLEEEENET